MENISKQITIEILRNMKQIFNFLVIAVVSTSCSVTIPIRTRLSDQTMLFIENRNIKVNYTIASNIPDGFISYVSYFKIGLLDNSSHKYAAESAFKEIWNLYFSSKFNPTSKNLMDVEVTLKDLKIREREETATSMALQIAKTKINIDVLATIYVLVNYQGKKYENQFDVNASDFNELRPMNSGNLRYTTYQKDPIELKAKLLEICLNKSIVKFEYFLGSIMLATKESM